MRQHRPAWRIPMVWLVAGIPLAAVIAGIALVIVAARQPNDAISDKVRRTAQIQTEDMRADHRARASDLRALVRSEDGVVEALPVSGTFDPRLALTVTFRHPARAAQDRVIRLQPTELGWRSKAPVDLSHDWNVELAPPDARWRLVGRLPKNQHAVLLQPALSSQ